MKRIAIWIAAFATGAGLAAPPPAPAATLFALVDTGELYTSADGGAEWQMRSALPAPDAVGLAAGANPLDLYLATRSGSIYHSTDAGATWTATGAVSAGDVAGFALGPFGTVFALTRTGTLYASGNGGATFTALSVLTGSAWVALSRGPLGRLYALASTGEVARSLDQGATWAIAGTVPVSNAVSLRRLGNDLLLLTGTGEIYRSADYGGSWIPVAALTSSGMSALVDVNGSQIVAAAATGEVASTADGVSWSWVGAINQLHVVALASDVPQVTGVPVDEEAPRFADASASPNPRYGAGGAVFGFGLERPDLVRIELYDIAGRLRAVRAFEWVPVSGKSGLRWDPPGLPSGTYLTRVQFGSGRTLATKWTVVR
jgi:hypothetical protein